jgi:PKD repeat protein
MSGPLDQNSKRVGQSALSVYSVMVPRLILFFALAVSALGSEFGISSASSLGGSGNDDSVRGVKILADGVVVLAANIGNATPGGTLTLLNGATAASSGALLRLSADGKTVLSVTRVAAEVRDLALDADDNLYVAAGAAGVLKLDSAATAVLWQAGAGSYMHRVDVGPSGRCVALSTTTPSNADEAAGPGTVWHFDPTGALAGSWPGKSNSMDVCLDEASQTIVTTGFRQANSYGPPGDSNGLLPVQISYLRGVDYSGTGKWLDYDWSALTGYDAATDSYVPGANNIPPAGLAQTKMDPRYINRIKNNMADTRGLRCAIGADGKLYAAYECAGGNHIFRDDVTDLAANGSIVGGDFFHQFINTGASHKTYIARYLPATGALLLGQQYAVIVSGSSGVPSANTMRMKAGDITADTSGRLMFGGVSAYGLPMLPNKYYTPTPGQQTFNPFNPQDYLGGAFMYVMSADFAQRLFVTRLSTNGTTHSVAARILPGETTARIAFGGSSALGAGPVYTEAAVQPTPGYGTQDGFVAVLGGGTGGASGAGYKMNYGGPGVSYTTGTLSLRDGPTVNSAPLDLDGDGKDDSERGYPFSTSVRLSPTTGYTGLPFYGGFRSRVLNSWTQSFGDNGLTGTEVRLRPIVTAGAPVAVHGLIYFDKADLPGLLPGDKLSFSLLSSLYANTGGMGRWVVRQQGVFFVSEVTITSSTSLNFASDTDDGRWATYDPAADLNFDSATALFESRNFDDISAVGFLIDSDAYSTSFFLRFSQFGADFAVNRADNSSPSASFTSSPEVGTVNFTPTFNASASSDTSGVTFYAWNFGDGTSGGGPTTTHSYTAAGPYLPSAKVYDAALQRSTATRRISATSKLGGSPTNTVAAFGGVVGATTFRPSTTISGVDHDGDGLDDFTVEIPLDPVNMLSSPTQKGTKFHGGLRSTERNALSIWADVGTTGSSLAWRIQPAAGAAVTTHGIIYIDKSEFLNRAHLRPVSFNAGSMLKLSGITRHEQLGQVRWLLREGAQFYVSQTLIPSNTATATLSFPSATDHGTWSAWTPAADINFDSASASFSTRIFTDVTAVGFVIDSDTPSAIRHWLEVSDIEVLGAIQQDNAAPVASISAAPLNLDVLQEINFSSSVATTGRIMSTLWDFGDGSTATTPSPSHVYLTPGTKAVTFTATDDLGQSTTQTLTYNVTPNSAPLASFTATPSSGNVPVAVSFNASASTDDSGIASYEWDFNGDGTWDATGVTATYLYTVPGLFPVKLRVTDGGGKTNTAVSNVRATTTGGFVPPIALFTPSANAGSAPLTVAVTALQSSDPDGSIASYAWDFTGDGVTDATGSATAWNYVSGGNQTIRLTVTDNDGATAIASQSVAVSLAPGAVPIAYWAGESVVTRQAFRNINTPPSIALDLDGDGTADDQRSHYPFSSTAPLSPSIGYTGTPFFGGIRNEVLNTNSYAPSDNGVMHSGNADFVSQRMQPLAGLPARWHWAFYLSKANFLNGGSNQPVRISATSRLRLAGISHSENLGTMRWMVRDGAQFYVTQATASVASNTATLTFATNASDGNWATFDPAADLNFDDNAATYTARNFSNITAAGFIIDKDTFQSLRHWFDFNTFEFIGALPPTFTEWMADYSTPQSGPLDDPDADGLANLAEYALGLNPNHAQGSPFSPLQVTDATGTHLALRVTRPTDRVGISIEGEVSTNLSSWSAAPSDVGQSTLDNGNGTETLTIWDKTSSSSAQRRFLRLRVTQP